jgi:hypothetical protein
MKSATLARAVLLGLGGALLVTACSSTPSMQKQASAEVGKALDAARACAKDDDCTATGFGASCFDSCTRAVAKDHVAEVEAASKKASAGACRGFAGQGCKMTVPPCAPPQTSRCTAGLCT